MVDGQGGFSNSFYREGDGNQRTFVSRFATIRAVWVLVFLLITTKLLVMFGMGLSTYVRRISTPEELNPTFSAGISINHITSVAMPMLAGILLPFIGYEGIFWGAASVIIISIPFAMALRVNDTSIAQVSSATAE